MFLAKTWKTVNGKRYPAWVLKKAVWDKDQKRQKQVYVAYVGTNKVLSWAKAQEICQDKNLSWDELQQVKRLRIEKPPEDKHRDARLDHEEAAAQRPVDEHRAEATEDEAEVGFDVPEATPAEMVRQLREYYGLGSTLGDYDDLAYRISPSIDAEELRMVEQDRAVLDGAEQERLRNKWRWMHGVIA
jgi:hypothetical protein